MLFDLVDRLLEALAGLSPAVLYLLTGLFTALETSALVGLVVPGDAVVLLAGTTATSPVRFLALVGAAVAGSLAGESVGYLLGRRFGDRIRTSRLGRRLGASNWAKAERFLNGRGGRAVFAARFVAVVHALLPVVAGAVRMPYRRFAGWAAAGSLAWSVLYVGAGAAAGASWRQFGERLGLAGYLILGGLVAAALLVRRARHRRNNGGRHDDRSHARTTGAGALAPQPPRAPAPGRADRPAGPGPAGRDRDGGRAGRGVPQGRHQQRGPARLYPAAEDPPLAEPRLDANGRKVFDLRLQPGTSELLPGRPAETWGVNGAYLGPTRELRGRFDGADDTFDLWKVRGAAWLLRHEDRGLMGQFVVVRPGQASQPPAHAHG
jgi:membrane-associated protein